MYRLGFAVVLFAAALACERSSEPQTVEPEPAASTPPPTDVESDDDDDDEPEPEPAPAAEPETDKFDAAEFSEGGFEARNLHCKFEQPSSKGTGYIKASLIEADAVIDACAPKGAAIEVSWSYHGGPVGDISVNAENQKVANCVASAFNNKVSAGLRAHCSAMLLIGDATAAAAELEASKNK